MSILIQNLTDNKMFFKTRKGPRPTNAVITTLKSKQEDPDVIVPPGQIHDLTVYGEDKVRSNAEIKKFIDMGVLKFLSEYPKTTVEEKKQMAGNQKKEALQERIEHIRSTDNLTELEDIVDDDDAPQELQIAALKRL